MVGGIDGRSLERPCLLWDKRYKKKFRLVTVIRGDQFVQGVD